jgi:hypothetical protein
MTNSSQSKTQAKRSGTKRNKSATILSAGILAEVDTSAKAGLLAVAPAFLALVVAGSSGVYALTHAVALPDFTSQLWMALALALLTCVLTATALPVACNFRHKTHGAASGLCGRV